MMTKRMVVGGRVLYELHAAQREAPWSLGNTPDIGFAREPPKLIHQRRLLQCKVLQKRDFVTTFVRFVDAEITLLHDGRPLTFGALRKLKDLVDKGFADGGGNGAGERRIAQRSGIRFSKKGKNGSEYGDEDHCDG